MKKITILAMCIVAMACSKTNDDVEIIEDISIEDISTENIYNIKNDFNKDEVAELLTTRAFIVDRHYYDYDFANDAWLDGRFVVGDGPAYHGFTLNGNSWISYLEPGGIPGMESQYGELRESACDVRFEKETSSLYFNSSYYDHEYSATIVYYDGEIVVFDGVLPHHDGVKDVYYPEKHKRMYVGIFSDMPVDEWVENLRQKIAEKHKDCNNDNQ